MAAFKQLARTVHIRVLRLQKLGVPPERVGAPAGIVHRALVHFLSRVDVAQRVRQRQKDAVVAIESILCPLLCCRRCRTGVRDQRDKERESDGQDELSAEAARALGCGVVRATAPGRAAAAAVAAAAEGGWVVAGEEAMTLAAEGSRRGSGGESCLTFFLGG